MSGEVGDARKRLSALVAPTDLLVVTRQDLADAWLLGHAAGRDYQGDGWNSYGHDPNDDNPFRKADS